MLRQPCGGWRPRDGEAPYFSEFPEQTAFADLDPDFKVVGQFVNKLRMLTIYYEDGHHETSRNFHLFSW